MRGNHHGSSSVKRHLYAGNRGPDARVFSDIAAGVLRHIEVGTDKNTLVLDEALGAQIRKTDELHVWLGKLNRSGQAARKRKL